VVIAREADRQALSAYIADRLAGRDARLELPSEPARCVDILDPRLLHLDDTLVHVPPGSTASIRVHAARSPCSCRRLPEIGHELRPAARPRRRIGRTQNRRGMRSDEDRGHELGGEHASAMSGHRDRPAQHGARRGRAEADDDARLEPRELQLEPWLARLDLADARLWREGGACRAVPT
jgi:hypothetical protein